MLVTSLTFCIESGVIVKGTGLDLALSVTSLFVYSMMNSQVFCKSFAKRGLFMSAFRIYCQEKNVNIKTQNDITLVFLKIPKL